MVAEHGLQAVAALAPRQGGQAALEPSRSAREDDERTQRDDEARREGDGDGSDRILDGCVQVDGGLLCSGSSLAAATPRPLDGH
jgi:hypothetical protein